MIIEENNLPQLPKGWMWTRLAEVGVVASGGTPSTKDEGNFGGEIPWLTPADLTNFQGKFILRGKRNLTKRGLASSSAVLLPSETILFSSRAPIGYVAIAGNPISTNQGFKNLVPFDGIFNEFVFYYLKSSKQLAESYASGTTFSEISGTRFGQLPFPLPPLPEQQRIVAKIEELFTKLDAGIEMLKKVKAQLKGYRQAVLKHAFEGKLTKECRETHKGEIEPTSVLLERIKEERKKNAKGKYKELPPIDTTNLLELPEGWVWTGVGSIVESMQNGIYKQRHFYSDDGVACLRMYNIEDGRIVWKDIKRMNLTKDEVKRYRLRLGDILVNRVNSRELVGKAAPIPSGLETCVYESKNIRIKLWSGIESKYVAFWFQVFAQRFFNRHAQQTVGMASINQEQIASMPIPLTVTVEQQQIISEIERCFSMADQIEKVVEQSLIQADRLRQSVLKRAFEGKLVAQDPTDEPAEKLLERIKAEKAKREFENRAAGRGRKRLNTIQGSLI